MARILFSFILQLTVNSENVNTFVMSDVRPCVSIENTKPKHELKLTLIEGTRGVFDIAWNTNE
jgi:hypothetical protein